MITNIKLLLLVIVLLIFNTSIIETFDTYKWTFETDPGFSPLEACSQTGLTNQTSCNISEESCRNDDGSFKGDGSDCTNNSGISGKCRNINNRIKCNISNENIYNRINEEITRQITSAIIEGNNYYTIIKDGTTKTHAPACNDNCDINVPSQCPRNCCLCSTDNWRQVYTSKPTDTLEGDIITFTGYNIFDTISNKSGYSILKLNNTNNGDITNKNDNDLLFKRYFDHSIPGLQGIETIKYTPSKGYFFNQFNPSMETENNYNLNEYPKYIQSNDNTQIEDPFFYEECIYNKISNNCACNHNSIPVTGGSIINKSDNPICSPCQNGFVVRNGACVGCAEHNKILGESGECVNCDVFCGNRNMIKCIYRDGECYSVDTSDKLIRSDCMVNDTNLDPSIDPSIINQCNINSYGTKVGDNLYHLSNDNINNLSEFYDACLAMPNCEVVQNLIDINEGYINYNDEINNPTNNTLGSDSNVLQYNMITNEFCKDINSESPCNQLKHCNWHYEYNKCLVNLDYNKYNIVLDNNSKLLYHYIPIPTYNEEINNYLSKECNGRNIGNCDINCIWDSSSNNCSDNPNTLTVCSPPNNMVKYYNKTDSGYGNNVSENNFNNKTECKSLTDYDTENTTNINYIGDVKGFCFDGIDELTPTGCVDSRVINDIILYKDQSIIDRSIEDAENNIENNITLINNCRELCDINSDICDDYGVKFPSALRMNNAGCYLVKAVNWECNGTVNSGDYAGLECSSTQPYLDGDTEWCEQTDGCSLEYIDPFCINSVDNPPGCIVRECTEPNVPYDGCIIPECTDVATPYDGCIVPYCTAPGQPYDECIRTICDENEYVSSTEDGLRCTPCAPGYHNEAGNVIFDGETTCTENLCVCDNGTPSIGIDCLNNGEVKCREGTCNDGYYFNNNDCLENLCVCDNGTAARGIDCPSDGDIKCIDGTCNDGYYFYNNDCLIKTCVCNYGPPATGEQCDINGNTRCIEPCDRGYHLSNNRCLQNVCVCENGDPSIGEDCPNNGEVKCNEGTCDDGYYFTNNNCLIKTCICEYGRHATGVECPNNEEVKCVEDSCNPGYHFNNDICIENNCTCDNGVASTGVDCPNPEVEGTSTQHCRQCNIGFHLDSDQCVVNVCTCPNGNPSTGRTCPIPSGGTNALHCRNCHSGYHLDNNQCIPNRCNCTNGPDWDTSASAGTCPTNGGAKCSSCNGDYYLSSDRCLEKIDTGEFCGANYNGYKCKSCSYDSSTRSGYNCQDTCKWCGLTISGCIGAGRNGYYCQD